MPRKGIIERPEVLPLVHRRLIGVHHGMEHSDGHDLLQEDIVDEVLGTLRSDRRFFPDGEANLRRH